MTSEYLSGMWTATAAALGNHLWQSTIFAFAAGLVTLILRKNQARVRYWVWLAASVKFLLPFSLLVSVGQYLGRSSARATSGLYVVMQEMNQPFTPATLPAISRATPAAVSASWLHLLPLLLSAIWLGGFAVVLFLWRARWRRVSAAMREAKPLLEGREVEVLRRLERSQGIGTRIEMLVSRTSLEPGIFGMIRPVLIWPEGISKHLEDAHVEAVLAHELRHVRRRDNLAAAIHMVVEAIFWFHPLVWWLGARMLEERERACDEEVVAMGGERLVYAESILKVCEFCVGSPLACVAGVTGADLKKRMVDIMTERIARKLDFSRKMLLSAAVMLALAVPVGFGAANATQGRAEAQEENAAGSAAAYKSASVRSHQPVNDAVERTAVMFSPNGFMARNVPLETVIGVAYGVQADLISGAPDWVKSEKYDIDVTLPDSAVEGAAKSGTHGIGTGRLSLMLRALLADRFKLTLHQQTKDLSVYELVVAGGGAKLQEAKPVYTNPNGINGPEGRLPDRRMMQMGPGELTGQESTLDPLVEQLSWQLGRTVLNKTGLKGTYDFSLRWTPGESEVGMRKLMGEKPTSDNPTSSAAAGPSIFTAIQEQLGLKLEPQMAPMQILVVDHVEKPGEASSS